MTTLAAEAGAPLKSFPRTLGIKNWPFVVFLALLAGGLYAGAVAMDDPGLGRILLFAVGGPTVLIVGVQLLREVFSAGVIDTVAKNGLLLRRMMKTRFMPWGDIDSIKERIETAFVNGVRIETVVYDLRFRGERLRTTITQVEGGYETARLIASSAGLTWKDGLAQRPG
jgi:hypothetical protein